MSRPTPQIPPPLQPELEALGDALARLMLEAWERRMTGGKAANVD